ncbi:GSCFA family protein [Echinicola strongylocentroti]|uniref:GSCFA family protein n=1 Tax=Echinicola strongylocentroti TaxID=1795355 RepID=A0A2Z4IEP4_9BACT|nr:GSCFA domain-containing protein [Echinicola strongylocentroti]AWW28913.1 GSCFA family protein [Echinicola strongylocentroti]
MSKFRSELIIEENPTKINKEAKIMSLGSGFSSMMAQNLRQYGLDVTSNPFGRIYNPISLFHHIELLGKHAALNESLLTEYEGNWNHFQYNFLRRQSSEVELIENIKAQVQVMQENFKKQEFLMINLGTAYVFRHLESKQVVANCHKAPQELFEKELLTPDKILESFRHIYPQLNHIKNIIFVLSPVMHTKDTITLNCVSKSVLRVAIHQIVNEFPEVKYFPAYELQMNDLRDYRFYERDLLQPNDQAIEYITSKFNEAYFDSKLLDASQEMDTIIQSINSLPYNPQSRDYVFEVNQAISKLKQLDNYLDPKMAVAELEGRLKRE